MAAIASGISQGAIRDTIHYVNKRVQFKKTISQFENTQYRLAEMIASTESVRALVWEAAKAKEVGDAEYASALAKLAAADNAALVTRKCLQLMGGRGYMKEYPIERRMRDAKMTELLGQAQECLKEYIAVKEVLLE